MWGIFQCYTKDAFKQWRLELHQGKIIKVVNGDQEKLHKFKPSLYLG